MAGIHLDQLGHCESLDEFHAACAPLGLYQDRRFLHLELDVINKCNIRCVMCFHSLEPARRARVTYMSPGTFAADAAPVLRHAHRLSLSLGNEPLLSPTFVPILAIAARHAVPHVNFFTNGLLLDDEKIDAIVEHGVTQVCISVDGATPATYNAIRRDGDFDVLVRNVERLVSRRNARGSVTPLVRLDVVMMQRNVHELPALVELAARLGAGQMGFRHLVSFEGLGMDGESLSQTPALSNYWLERAMAAAAELGIEVQTHPAPFTLGDEEAPAPAPASPYAATPYCPYPFFHISMGPGGHVHPCPHSHGEAPYGRVSGDTPLERVWLNEKFTILRQRILRHDPPDMCRRCAFLAFHHPDVADLFVTRRS